MVEKEILKKIGLTDNETKVYLALLELGESLASKIGEKVNINRTHVYDIIESLIEKGLISYVVKNNKKYFNAAHPKRLIDYLHEKEIQLREQEENLRKIVPELLSLRKPKKEVEKVEIYKGKEGIKTVYNDILRTTKEYYVLGATGQIADHLRYYFPGHEKERIKKRIKLKLLFNKHLKGKVITKRKFAEIRYLPGKYTSPIPTTIYNNKVIILVWTTPSAIVIENKEIAQTYKSYFNLLWDISQI